MQTCYLLKRGQSVTLVTITLVTAFLCPGKYSLILLHFISRSKFSLLYQLSNKNINNTVSMPEWGHFCMMFYLKMSLSFGCNVSNHDLKNCYDKTMQYRDVIFLPNLSLMVIYWPKKSEASIILCHKLKCWQSLNNCSKCNVSNRNVSNLILMSWQKKYGTLTLYIKIKI